MDDCWLPHGFWELSPGPLEQQPILLTPESSPQLLTFDISFCVVCICVQVCADVYSCVNMGSWGGETPGELEEGSDGLIDVINTRYMKI